MKISLLVLLLSFSTAIFANPDITELRSLMNKAASSKKSWIEMSKLLAAVDTKSPALLVCYKGVSTMMEAKYSISPWGKLSSFRSGKRLIEDAIKRENKNLEMRFLRYTVQTNIPAFLDYDGHIQSDKQFIIDNIRSLKDKDLKNRILQYMLISKTCTEEEITKLRNDG